MAEFKCTVEHVRYQSPETGWAVLQVKTTDGKPYTVTGTFAEIAPGTDLIVKGRWTKNARYGQQLEAESWELSMPVTKEAIERYLGSGAIAGIGPAYAKAIVRTFGENTIEVLDNEPVRLSSIQGLGPKRIKKITESWATQKLVRNVMVFLQGHGISPTFANKIFKAYGQESISRVKSEPYLLANDVRGIGFTMADKLARNLGYGHDDPRRCRAGILYALQSLSEEGHVFAGYDQLRERCIHLLGIDEGLLSEALASGIRVRDIIAEGDAFYLPALYRAEKNSARLLSELMKAPASVKADDCLPIAVGKGLEFDSVQQEAVLTALRSKVMVLTGGPGTGKTTTVRGIIHACKEAKMKILLCAPTGRAAKRMSEATGMEAMTIHRLLGYNPAEGWGHNAEDPLQGDILIVDESSMIDIQLLHALLSAVPKGMRLIFVGDADQLPSVGPGDVLRDIIESGHVPCIRLSRIFRQALSSRIITNAHAINAGHMPDISNGRDTDFFFIREEDESKIPATIVDLVSRRLPGHYGIPSMDIQVLSPMRKSETGTETLNQLLQGSLNPKGLSLKRGEISFRKGDKVMQISNNYDKKVFNGDIGRISGVDPEERTLEVDFEGRTVEYESGELEELAPAYAVTVHKSQGSEFPIVVIPVTMKHFKMLQRNLIYTGVTRARKACVLVGNVRALSYAVSRNTLHARNSGLAARIVAEVS